MLPITNQSQSLKTNFHMLVDNTSLLLNSLSELNSQNSTVCVCVPTGAVPRSSRSGSSAHSDAGTHWDGLRCVLRAMFSQQARYKVTLAYSADEPK